MGFQWNKVVIFDQDRAPNGNHSHKITKKNPSPAVGHRLGFVIFFEDGMALLPFIGYGTKDQGMVHLGTPMFREIFTGLQLEMPLIGHYKVDSIQTGIAGTGIVGI